MEQERRQDSRLKTVSLIVVITLAGKVLGLVRDMLLGHNFGTGMAHWANLIPSPIMNCSLNPWADGHKMMEFPKKPFHEVIKGIGKSE